MRLIIAAMIALCISGCSNFDWSTLTYVSLPPGQRHVDTQWNGKEYITTAVDDRGESHIYRAQAHDRVSPLSAK
jgi:hypothetical protein